MDAEINGSLRLPEILQGKLFTVTQYKADHKVTAKCTMCKENDPYAYVEGSIKNTFNFRRHYKRHHSEIVDFLNDEPNATCNKRKMSSFHNNSTGVPSKKLKLLDGSQSDHKLVLQKKQKLFNIRLIKFIVHSMKPYNTVDDEYFRDMIGALDSDVHVISRRTLCRRLNDIFQEVKAKLTESFKSVKYLSSTADIWSTKHRSFLGVTLHYIDAETFERRSAVLACRRFEGRHTFDRIAVKLDIVYKEYELDHLQIISTVTDNARNFVKAFQEFGYTENSSIKESQGSEISEEGINYDSDESSQCDVSDCNDDCDLWVEFSGANTTDSDDDDGSDETLESDNSKIIHHHISECENASPCITLPKHLRCASHKINLLSTTDFAKFIKSSDLQVVHNCAIKKCEKLWSLSKRPMTSEKIKEKLGCNLKYPTFIRWNTFHDSLGDIVKFKPKLKDLMEELKIEEFTDDELAYLEKLYDVMKPVAVALHVLQADHCYYGELVPVLFSLRTELSKFFEEGQLSYLYPMIPHLLHHLNKRFDVLFSISPENIEALAVAVLLPKRKMTWLPDLYDNALLEEIKDLVLEACKQCISLEEEEEFRASFDDNKGTANDNYVIFNSEKTAYQSVEEEFNDYIADKSESIKTLDGYPRLKKAFLRYNTSLCSSAPVERLFSIGGILLGSRTCSLSDDSFELACVLKANPKSF